MAGLTAAAEGLGAAAKITTNAELVKARRAGEGRRHIRLIDHHLAQYYRVAAWSYYVSRFVHFIRG